jgi:hypothetical protein
MMRIDQRRYELDDYTNEEFSDDSINVQCVLSYTVGSSQSLRINFHNGFHFDSDSERCPRRHRDAVPRVLAALRSNAKAELLQ